MHPKRFVSNFWGAVQHGMQGFVASGCLAGQHLIIYTRARNGQSGVGETLGK